MKKYKLKYLNKKIKIGIIGGKLQGLEASYLIKQEKYYLLIIDKNKNVHSKIFADKFVVFDIIKHKKKYIRIVNKLDYLLPVNENIKTLNFIRSNLHQLKCKVLFDFDSYNISRSKKDSKLLFKKLNISTPNDNPKKPPYFIKPNDESGSNNARLVMNKEELSTIPKNYIIEEYINGPIISLEVVGNKEKYIFGVETRVHIDNNYDCFKVTSLKENIDYRNITLSIAKELKLDGIMDIEAIEYNNKLIVLEIDARFPSQTPICVYHTSGINLIKELINIKNKNYNILKYNNKYKYCLLEHFEKTKENNIIFGGEHIISNSQKYCIFYIDKTNGIEIFRGINRNKNFVYTLISYGNNETEVLEKTMKIINKL